MPRRLNVPAQAQRARSLVDRLNHLMSSMTPMRAYAYGRLTTDAGDEEAQAAIGYLTKQGIRPHQAGHPGQQDRNPVHGLAGPL